MGGEAKYVGCHTLCDMRRAPKTNACLLYQPYSSSHVLLYMCVQVLCDLGYSATDIITTLFRVTKNADAHEFVKLEFLRVGGGGYGQSGW